MRLLFVVHRMYPWPGGSEVYVNNMAQECVKRGYDVTVLADTHQGNVGKVTVNSDYKILDEVFDLIIVHGGDCSTQNVVHRKKQKSPVLYMIIYPSSSPVCLEGMKNADYLGYSTEADYTHAVFNGYKDKLVKVRHGIDTDALVRNMYRGCFKHKYNLQNKKMVMSAGGFWPHKNFDELAIVFNELKPKTLVLGLFGYAMPAKAPYETEWVRTFYGLYEKEFNIAFSEADFYIMNSSHEGFGLVLLEAMYMGVPWAARPVGGVTLPDMKTRGVVYDNRDKLIELIKDLDNGTFVPNDVEYNHKYIMMERKISNTVDDIMVVAQRYQ